MARRSVSRPRTSTRDPLNIDEPSPLSPSAAAAASSHRAPSASPRTSLSHRPRRTSTSRSPGRVPSSATVAPITARDFSYLLKPEIYHQISPLTTPAPFRTSASSSSASPHHPSPETPIPELLAHGHFRAAAIAAVQALTSSPVPAQQAAAHPPVTDPTDAPRIFSLLYTRLACLCLIDAVPFAAQESKALEDLTSAFYVDASEEGAGQAGGPPRHLCPWELRVLAVRLQTIGFGDPRRAIMSLYDLARDARSGISAARRSGDQHAEKVWTRRLTELGIRVAGALIEMDDLAGAADHLVTLGMRQKMLKAGETEDEGDVRLAMSKSLLWLHLGDVEAARECMRRDGDGEGESDGDTQLKTSERVVDALADMADGEHEVAAGKWRILADDMARRGEQDEMVGVNLAVCLLYTGRINEGRQILEGLVDSGRGSRSLLFNLTTMYELCSDRAKNLKLKLADRMAAMEPTAQGWEKTNADLKL